MGVWGLMGSMGLGCRVPARAMGWEQSVGCLSATYSVLHAVGVCCGATSWAPHCAAAPE